MNYKESNKFNTNQSLKQKPLINPVKTLNIPSTSLKQINYNIKTDNNDEKPSIKKLNEDLNNTNNKTSLNNSLDSIDENSNEVVAKILDTINKNSLSIFYDSDSEFKNKIDSLNLKFYLETEKYLCNQNKKFKTQTSLFIILFKQINIYIEEIQRLNLILLTKKYKTENIIKRTNELTLKKKELQTKEDIIKALKISQFNMETKLLQAIINENNLNKKIENLQKEIEIYKNKILSMNNTSETQTIKIDKIMSNSFRYKNEKKELDEGKHKINNNQIKKSSHNSVCITINHNNNINNNNINNNNINNNFNINISKSIKSKSPNSVNTKEYPIKLNKFTNSMSVDIKRNHSQNESKLKMNNSIKNETEIKNKTKCVLNKDKIKKHNNNEMIYLGSLITKLNKTEKVTKNNSKVKIEQETKNNNTIDLSNNNNNDLIQRNNYKKIIINNKNTISGDENLTNRKKKKINNNNLENDLNLFNSYLNNNSYNLIKTTKTKILKSDLDRNKYSDSNYKCFNTIENENEKQRYENAFNYFKLFKNKQKKSNENNNNINKVINKSILNDLKSKSLFKNKDKTNRNRNKNIINISNSTGVKKNINGSKIKKI